MKAIFTHTQTAAATIGLHNQITVRKHLREAHLHVRHPHRVLTWLQFVVVIDLSGQMLTFDGVWHFGEVFPSRMNPGFHCTGQIADSVWAGERFADVNVVDRVAHGGGGVMIWAGVCYGQRIQVHFTDGILNAPRYRDEILRPIVVPFIHDHHLMLQHDNARPHVARICSQFLEAENIPVLAWPAYSLDTSPIEHVWEALDRCIRQRVPVPANIQQLHTTLKRSGPTLHRPQSTTWSTLCEGDVLHCVRQMVVTPDTDWFSDPSGPPQYSKTAHFRVAFYCVQPKAHLCNNHAV